MSQKINLTQLSEILNFDRSGFAVEVTDESKPLYKFDASSFVLELTAPDDFKQDITDVGDRSGLYPLEAEFIPASRSALRVRKSLLYNDGKSMPLRKRTDDDNFANWFCKLSSTLANTVYLIPDARSVRAKPTHLQFFFWLILACTSHYTILRRAIGAIGVTTVIMSSIAPAQAGTGPQSCHNNIGSMGCNYPAPAGPGFIYNNGLLAIPLDHVTASISSWDARLLNLLSFAPSMLYPCFHCTDRHALTIDRVESTPSPVTMKPVGHLRIRSNWRKWFSGVPYPRMGVLTVVLYAKIRRWWVQAGRVPIA